MKKKNLLLVILLLVVVAVASTATFAWLTDTGSAEAISYTVGDVSYEITKSEAPTGTYVVPGQSLGKVVIVNKSNVLTNIRVQLGVTVTGAAANANTDWSVGLNKDSDEVLLTQPASSKWYLTDDLNATGDVNQYYYYGTVTDGKFTEEDIAVADAIGTTLNDLIESLVLNGALVGNDYSGATVTITVTFYAKQAEHVEWSEMGSINFKTGLAPQGGNA